LDRPCLNLCEVSVSSARLAAILLIDFPGAAYFSGRIVETLKPFVDLHQVADAPEFGVPVFASYLNWTGKISIIQSAIDFLSRSGTE